MEEFEEADIMWPDQIADDDYFGWSRGADEDFSTEKSNDGHGPSTVKESLTVPINIIKRKASSCSDWKLKFDCYVGDSKTSDGDSSGDFIGDIIPPHLLVSKRSAGMMVGESRALKGRRLSDVRNSILRMTGFLEA